MKRFLCFAAAVLLLCLLSAVAIGEGDSPPTVFWGHYPQQSNDPEPIKWLVLGEQDGQVLLLAKDCLASLPWHNAHIPITWDQSDIRAWLNGEFLQTAFTEEEQAVILLTDLNNGDDWGYGTPVGENTQDKVFLLSGSEVEQYLPADDLHTVAPTRYALSQGAYTNSDGLCAWWLRSPGLTGTSPAYLSSAGPIGNRTHEVNETIIGVRPAIWISQSALSTDESVGASE